MFYQAMLRRLVRMTGFLLLAGSVIVAVIDGARWIATDRYLPVPLSSVIQEVLGARVMTLLQGGAPFVTDYVVKPLLGLPAFAVLLTLAGALLWVGAPRVVTIGFMPRP